MSDVQHACPQCPWRLANQGKKHRFGFYTKTNLKRLWSQIRGGGGQQSCHLTDPQHPDHVACGAPENGVAKECPGSVVLVMREFAQLADKKGNITPETIDGYRAKRKRGLTRPGLQYWLLSRLKLGGVPMLGGPKLPVVDVDDPAIGLPEFCNG